MQETVQQVRGKSLPRKRERDLVREEERVSVRGLGGEQWRERESVRKEKVEGGRASELER